MKRLIFLVTFIIASFPLIAAESLESGMQDLATQIVTNSKANNKQSIAVAPFPHSDGTYSELSNYLVDELVLKLFTVPESNLEIMERTQLSTIFEELNISLVGAISPDSIKELGKL
ncbi:MAG: hypothetical protein IID61_18840, partial [SAR324 cluster bacterium]|nr:hypothetical protein [SAR324 cluster bacterium]